MLVLTILQNILLYKIQTAPPRVLSAMALAMIYSTHLSIVCEEENYCIKDLFDEDINLAIYDEKKIH
jgi:hypothetical protein